VRFEGRPLARDYAMMLLPGFSGGEVRSSRRALHQLHQLPIRLHRLELRELRLHVVRRAGPSGALTRCFLPRPGMCLEDLVEIGMVEDFVGVHYAGPAALTSALAPAS